MKSYSNLSLQEQMNLSPDLKDRFMTYAKNRVSRLLNTGTMNERVHALFQGKDELSINRLIEHFYLTHKTNYDGLVEAFNRYTESSIEMERRFDRIIEAYCAEVSKNPYFPTSHLKLNESINISPEKTLAYLLNEGCNVLSNIDVRSKLKTELFESVNAKQACLEIKDDPNYVLGLAESLSTAINYVLPKCSDTELIGKSVKFLESLNNIYSIYKEGMDLVKTQEYQASELFDLFMTGRATAYHFSIHKLNIYLKDPASFVQRGLR